MAGDLNSPDITQKGETESDRSILLEQIDQQRAQLDHLSEQMRLLSQEIIIAQEKERQRMARELHDEAGQALTIVKVSLELLSTDLAKEGVFNGHVEAIRKRLGEAILLCDHTMSQIRRLANNLHPAALEDLGLNLALQGLCSDFAERTRHHVSYTGIIPPVLSEEAQICLYRFLQEGLTNVVKHAHARQVEVELSKEPHQVMLVVKDDGIGFNCQHQTLSEDYSKGMGLRGLDKRLSLLGGRLEIVSFPEKGTTLRAIVPCEGGYEPDRQNPGLPGR